MNSEFRIRVVSFLFGNLHFALLINDQSVNL